MKRVKVGDLIEIKTALGYAYAQYTHKHSVYGALLRVFNTIYSRRPDSLKDVVEDRVRFSNFFPLMAAVKQGVFPVVGNYAVRQELKQFPQFRAGVFNPETRKVAVWWLWDGEKEERLGGLTEEQKQLPIRGVWNDTLLIERIESGWTPATDPTT